MRVSPRPSGLHDSGSSDIGHLEGAKLPTNLSTKSKTVPPPLTNLMPADIVKEDTLEDVMSPIKVPGNKLKLFTDPKDKELGEDLHAFLANGTHNSATPPCINITVGEQNKAQNNQIIKPAGMKVVKSPIEPSSIMTSKNTSKNPSPHKGMH